MTWHHWYALALIMFMMYVLYAHTHGYDELQINMHNERETKRWMRRLERLRRKVSEQCKDDSTEECQLAKLELSKMEDDHIF